MLEDLIIPSIQEVYGNGFNRVWFMQDGAPAHRRLTVKNKLQEAFGHRVIALGFDTEWPPRSPDLTPCDFYLWGQFKKNKFTKLHLHHYKFCVRELKMRSWK